MNSAYWLTHPQESTRSQPGGLSSPSTLTVLERSRWSTLLLLGPKASKTSAQKVECSSVYPTHVLEAVKCTCTFT